MPKSLGPGKWIDPRLELNLSMALRETLEATDFVHSIHGRIFVHYEQDESEQVAGYVRASLLQFGDALEHGVSGDQLGDGISGDIAEYWELLFDLDTGMWKDDLQTEFEIDRTDLLIIDCIELQPELRGHGVGALAVERVIELFGVGCGVVACSIGSVLLLCRQLRQFQRDLRFARRGHWLHDVAVDFRDRRFARSGA